VGGDRYAEARDLFLAALEHPPDRRPAFLQEACAGDEELRREVESLLAHHDDDGSSALMEATTAVRPTKPAPPRRIGPYRLLQKLGEGGMGEVYEAEQEAPVKRRVAIKLVKWGMSGEEVLARFDSERQALALMSHPNIARVYDAGATGDGRPYFAMEHVPGVPLTAYCDTHRLSVEERLRLFILVCHGVQHAHQKGVIHRDLKPSNILVTLVDDEPVPKIIDFGVAKATSARLTERTLFTQLGQWIGTPEYMSPEQAEMTGLDIDTRTDVYSLGVVLYELLVGARPFDPKELRDLSFDELRRTIREKEPTRPSTRVSGLGADSGTTASNRRTDVPSLARVLRGDLDWVTMKALEKDRTRRYGSPADLGADIERHLRDEPVLASPPSTAYRLRKFVRRHRMGVAASALVVTALVVAVVGTSIGLLRAKREAENARQVSELLVGIFEELNPDSMSPTLSVNDILARGAGRLDRELEDQPLVQARLQTAIGYASSQLGDHDAGRALLEDALETRRALLGDEHPDVAWTLNRLGLVYYWAGEHGRAREAFGRAVEILEAAHGPDTSEVAEALTNLGFVLWRSGDLVGARAHLERALAIQETSRGPDDFRVANALYFLGIVALDEWDHASARSALQRALVIREQTLGPDHPSVGWPLHELGRVELATGDHEAARSFFERALAVQEKALGPDHLNVAFPVTGLAQVHSLAGEYDEADALFERSLAIREGALGTDHPDLTWTLRPWAAHLGRRGDPDGGRRLFEWALAIAEKEWGPDGIEVSHCLADHSLLEYRAGDYVRARELRERALAITRKTLGSRHAMVGRDLYNLACLDALEGHEETALERLREAIDAGWATTRILDDPDLDSLRGDPRFEALVAEVRARLEERDREAAALLRE
jgi:non-specific serine/threonine protein kinase/serine/threonine-protein kinase